MMNLALARAVLLSCSAGSFVALAFMEDELMILSEFSVENEQVAGTAVEESDLEEPDQSLFKSRKGALVWFFKKSRDNWKAKYARTKSEEVKLRKKIAYLVREIEKERALIASFSERCSKLQDELAIAKDRNAQLQAKSELLEPNALFFGGPV
jgi:chromosome segregation ATPase